MIGLFLDDRFLTSELPKYLERWEWVRNFDEFTQFITKYHKETGDLPALISFDHELEPEHYSAESIRPVGGTIFYAKFKKETGWHAARWLVEFCKQHDLDLNRVCVHSDNPMGSLNIQYELNQYKKERGNMEQPCFTMRWRNET